MRARVKAPDVIVEYGQWFVDSDTDTDPVTVETDHITGVKYGLLHTHSTILRVNDGDYVIKFPDGNLTACNAADFADKYEAWPLQDREPPDDTSKEPKKLKAKSE